MTRECLPESPPVAGRQGAADPGEVDIFAERGAR
jgi:hypothetical protein